MFRDSSPRANDPINPTQPPADAVDERFVAALRALYVAPQVPQHLKQTGAEQLRLQLAASSRRRARYGVFGFLHRVFTASAAMSPVLSGRIGALSSNRSGARAHLERSSRPTNAAAVAAVALVSLLAIALFAWPAPFHNGFTRWPILGADHGQHPPAATASPAIPRVTLTSVAMVSANDGWAFGGKWLPIASISSTPPTEPTPLRSTCLVLHYNGITWSRYPNSACIEATSISMLSANEGWAVGWNKILHYAHGDWQVDTTYMPSGQSVQLERVAMVSPNEGWVVGWSDSRAFVLHYAQGRWVPADVAGMAGVGTSALRGITMVSAQEGWAVGSRFMSSGESTLMLHYTSGQWTRVDWSIPGSFNAVAAFPSGDVWAVGEDNPASGPGLVVHLLRGIPIQQDRPIPGLLQDLAMISPGEGWAVGDGAATVHYHNGVWTRGGLTIHQFALMDVSLVSATEGWAVGSSIVDSSRDPNSSATLFHLSGGAWQIYPLSGV